MTLDQWILLAQLAAVAATVLAVVTALWLGKRDRDAADQRAVDDRRAADDRAAADRRAAAAEAERRFELELLLRLLVNLEAPGTSKNPEADRGAALGAERRGIAVTLGPDRLPITWDALVGRTHDDLRRIAAKSTGHDAVSRLNRAGAEVALELDRLRRLRTDGS